MDSGSRCGGRTKRAAASHDAASDWGRSPNAAILASATEGAWQSKKRRAWSAQGAPQTRCE
eukprot:15188119-Alexandrium_andersonii.AAC.1